MINFMSNLQKQNFGIILPNKTIPENPMEQLFSSIG